MAGIDVAENSMRQELAKTSLADLARSLIHKAPATFSSKIQDWLTERANAR
jgi:hypothetical protein